MPKNLAALIKEELFSTPVVKQLIRACRSKDIECIKAMLQANSEFVTECSVEERSQLFNQAIRQRSAQVFLELVPELKPLFAEAPNLFFMVDELDRAWGKNKLDWRRQFYEQVAPIILRQAVKLSAVKLVKALLSTFGENTVNVLKAKSGDKHQLTVLQQAIVQIGPPLPMNEPLQRVASMQVQPQAGQPLPSLSMAGGAAARNPEEIAAGVSVQHGQREEDMRADSLLIFRLLLQSIPDKWQFVSILCQQTGDTNSGQYYKQRAYDAANVFKMVLGEAALSKTKDHNRFSKLDVILDTILDKFGPSAADVLSQLRYSPYGGTFLHDLILVKRKNVDEVFVHVLEKLERSFIRAVAVGDKSGDLLGSAIVTLLLTCESSGNTALDLAIRRGSFAQVKSLLKLFERILSSVKSLGERVHPSLRKVRVDVWELLLERQPFAAVEAAAIYSAVCNDNAKERKGSFDPKQWILLQLSDPEQANLEQALVELDDEQLGVLSSFIQTTTYNGSSPNITQFQYAMKLGLLELMQLYAQILARAQAAGLKIFQYHGLENFTSQRKRRAERNIFCLLASSKYTASQLFPVFQQLFAIFARAQDHSQPLLEFKLEDAYYFFECWLARPPRDPAVTAVVEQYLALLGIPVGSSTQAGSLTEEQAKLGVALLSTVGCTDRNLLELAIQAGYLDMVKLFGHILQQANAFSIDITSALRLAKWAPIFIRLALWQLQQWFDPTLLANLLVEVKSLSESLGKQLSITSLIAAGGGLCSLAAKLYQEVGEDSDYPFFNAIVHIANVLSGQSVSCDDEVYGLMIASDTSGNTFLHQLAKLESFKSGFEYIVDNYFAVLRSHISLQEKAQFIALRRNGERLFPLQLAVKEGASATVSKFCQTLMSAKASQEQAATDVQWVPDTPGMWGLLFDCVIRGCRPDMLGEVQVKFHALLQLTSDWVTQEQHVLAVNEFGLTVFHSLILTQQVMMFNFGFEQLSRARRETGSPQAVGVIKQLLLSQIGRAVDGLSLVHLVALCCWNAEFFSKIFNELCEVATPKEIQELFNRPTKHGHLLHMIILGCHRANYMEFISALRVQLHQADGEFLYCTDEEHARRGIEIIDFLLKLGRADQAVNDQSRKISSVEDGLAGAEDISPYRERNRLAGSQQERWVDPNLRVRPYCALFSVLPGQYRSSASSLAASGAAATSPRRL